MRRLALASVVLLSACASAPNKSPPPVAHAPPPAHTDARGDAPATALPDACAPTRVHRDSDYTPGGLYAPGVADGRPERAIDVSNVAEPVPRREPRAATGNRSPYSVLGKTYKVMDDEDAHEYHERGVASWYGTKFNGRFQTFTAQINLDPADPTKGSITGTVKLDSVNTRDSDRDASLLDKDWFNAKQYPEAKFESQKIEKTADGYVANGNLTLNDLFAKGPIEIMLLGGNGRRVKMGIAAPPELCIRRKDNKE